MKKFLSLFVCTIILCSSIGCTDNKIDEANGDDILPDNLSSAVSAETTMPIHFEGSYENDGKHEKTEEVKQILAAVESKLCNYEKLIDGTTYGDIIYYYVDDPEDCFPSSENPIYSIIIGVSDHSVFYENAYDVYYLIGIGNGFMLDLYFSVPYDLSDIIPADITLRDTKSQTYLYNYSITELSTNQMHDHLCNMAVTYMPELSIYSTWQETTPFPESTPEQGEFITVTDFDGQVDISDDPNCNEYLFEMFFDETFGDTEKTWQYIGTTHATFALPEYEFYSFEIYKVDNTYYLIPFNEYTSSPTVYEFIEGCPLSLVWTLQY